MVEGDLFLAAIAGFFAGIFFFFRGFTWFRQKKLIENTPTSKIRSMAMGPVEIFGAISPGKDGVIKSPLTKNDCVYYRYLVEEYRNSGKTSSWVAIKKGQDGKLFYLKDETGSVLVDSKDSEVNIPADFNFTTGLGTDPPQNVKEFLRSNNLRFEGFLGINKSMRFTEYIIAPNDKVYIIGTAGRNPFVRDATTIENEQNIMIQKGRKDSFYYISDKSERDVLKDFGLRVFGGIFGGALLTLICLAVILIYLKLL